MSTINVVYQLWFSINYFTIFCSDLRTMLQINLCQKLLFLHQLWRHIVHWIPSSIHENFKLKPVENMLCTGIVFGHSNNFCTQHVLPMFCSAKRRASYKDLSVKKPKLFLLDCLRKSDLWIKIAVKTHTSKTVLSCR